MCYKTYQISEDKNKIFRQQEDIQTFYSLKKILRNRLFYDYTFPFRSYKFVNQKLNIQKFQYMNWVKLANLLVVQISCSIIERVSYQFWLDSGCNYTSFSVHTNNFMLIQLESPKLGLLGTGTSSLTYNYFNSKTLPISTTSLKLRTSLFNNITGNIYIIFDNTYLFLQYLSSGSYQLIYTSPAGITIINSCFGANTSQLYTLILNSTMGAYQLIYNKSGIVNKTTLTASTSSANTKMLYKDNLIYIQFQTGIQILSGNNSLLSLKTISFPSISIYNIDLSVGNMVFAYAYNRTITIVQVINFTTVWERNLTQPINGIKFVLCYLIVYANPSMYQIDLQIGQIIFGKNYTYPGMYLVQYIASTDNIIFYLRDGLSNKYWSYLDFNTEYSNNTCYSTYKYFSFNFSCVKNCSTNIIINNINFNATAANTSTNITNNITTNITNNSTVNITSNTTNNTVNGTVNLNMTSNITLNNTNNSTATTNTTNNNNISNISTEQSSAQTHIYSLFNSLDSPQLTQAIEVFGKSMVVTSFKITPNFLLAFTAFLDDLWYYRYHRKVYPIPVQWFMKEVNIINQLRLSPWFLQFINTININYVCIPQNNQRYSYLNFTDNDPQAVYFLYSSQDIYQSNLILNIAFLIIMKLLCIITNKIYKIYRGKNILRTIAYMLKFNTRIWVLFIALIENNTIKIAFNSFLQFLSNGQLQIQDKFNLLATYTFLFMLIIYSVCFYPLIYTWQPKKYSEILLIKYKHKLPGFCLQCITFVCRNLLRAIVHSFFITNYPLQITLLAAIDLIFVFISIKALKFFKYRIVGVLCVLYYIWFFFFDLYFCIIHNYQRSLVQNWDPQQVSFIILAVLVAIAILISLTLLLANIISLFKIIIKKYIKTIANKQNNQNQIKHQKQKHEQKKVSNKNIKKKKDQNKDLKDYSKDNAAPRNQQKKKQKKLKSQKKYKDVLKIQNYAPTPLIRFTQQTLNQEKQGRLKMIVKIRQKK